MRFLFAVTASTLAALVGGLAVGSAAPVGTPAGAPIDVTLALPLRNPDQLEALVAQQADPRSPLFHRYLTPGQVAAAFGPAQAHLRAAVKLMTNAGFSLTGTTASTLRFRASAATAQRTFGVHLHAVRTRSGAARWVTSERVTLPPQLAATGAIVVGLRELGPKHVDSRIVASPQNRYSAAGGYWYTDLKEAYRYPSFLTGLIGTGVKIGILMDSNVAAADIATYFQAENFKAYSRGVPLPAISVRPVLGGAPGTSPTNPYNPNTDGVEASIDLEQSLGSAPGASAILYDVPDLTDESLLAGYAQIVQDNAVDVVSTSLGTCELAYTAAYNGGQNEIGILRAYHALFLQGNAQGITFVASAGDGGGLACPSTAYANPPHAAGTFVKSVDWPASDPNVTGVGGTNLVTATPPPTNPSSLRSTYVAENAYGDPQLPYDPDGYGALVSGGVWGSGSGPSAIFAKPAYQYLVDTRASTRAVPDVSMHMGGCPGGTSVLGGPTDTCGYAPPLFDHQPRSYDWVYYGPNGLMGLIGTSAAAPEFAGLVALGVQSMHSRLGNVNVLMYRLAADPWLPALFHRAIPGWNGVVELGAQTRVYSPILGLGTPNAENLLGRFNLPVATDPQTPGNP